MGGGTEQYIHFYNITVRLDGMHPTCDLVEIQGICNDLLRIAVFHIIIIVINNVFHPL